MRKLLQAVGASINSTSSRLLRACGGGGDSVDEETKECLSPNGVVASQFDDSNHEDENEEDDKDKKKDVDRSLSDNQRLPHQQLQQSQQEGLDMPHEDLLRITKHDSKKERRHKYKQCFVRNNVVMTVTKDDILLEQDEQEDERLYFDSDLYKGSLVIPRDNHHTVTNGCLICLEEYQPGDHVVWSTNPQCEHAFHRDCIVKYFDKLQRRVPDTPCPCCRVTYTDLTVQIRAKKRASRPCRMRTNTCAIIAGFPWFR